MILCSSIWTDIAINVELRVSFVKHKTQVSCG
jgi:hypothetical protein